MCYVVVHSKRGWKYWLTADHCNFTVNRKQRGVTTQEGGSRVLKGLYAPGRAATSQGMMVVK